MRAGVRVDVAGDRDDVVVWQGRRREMVGRNWRHRDAEVRGREHNGTGSHGIDDLETSSWRCVFVAIRFSIAQDGGGRMIFGKRLLADWAGFGGTQKRMSTSRSKQCLETVLW